MKILAVDNDNTALQSLFQNLKEVFPSDEIDTFTNPFTAIKHLSDFSADTALVFCALLLRPVHSFDFAALVRRVAPGAGLLFTTQTDNYEQWALVKQIWGADCITQQSSIQALRDATSFLSEPCIWEDCAGCVCGWCKERAARVKKQV